MRPDRMIVPLRNFNHREPVCKCGECGKGTDPELMVRVQAFIYILEAIYDAGVRCFITGPARCIPHHINVYRAMGVNDFRESYHMGENRGRNRPTDDPEGKAVDCVFEFYRNSTWNTIDKAIIAKHAIDSKLFGGVGWKIYGPNSRFTHLDLGPVREF